MYRNLLNHFHSGGHSYCFQLFAAIVNLSELMFWYFHVLYTGAFISGGVVLGEKLLDRSPSKFLSTHI